MLRYLVITLLLVSSIALSGCAEIIEVLLEEEDSPAVVEVRPTMTPRARATPSITPSEVIDDGDDEGGSWLVMIYSDADDEVLEYDMFTDLNEAELVGSSENVTIVAQMDRYDGGFDGDGDWTTTKRFLIEYDEDLDHINSTEIEDLGELNMADGQTLIDFATWAIENYPADRYAIILSDHGMGWPGGWTDPEPPEAGPDGLDLTSNGDILLLNEMSEAFGTIVEETGIGKLDLIGFDACLMGHVEVAAALAPHARYMVASQEVEPALGWAYASFLQALSDNPSMNGAELAQTIVDTYIDKDSRIINEDARAKFIEEYYNGEPSVAQLIADFSGDITLSAYDLSEVPNLLSKLENFAYAIHAIDQSLVAKARTYSQSFEDVFGEAPSYIDLGHFANLIAELSEDDNVIDSVHELNSAIAALVLAERHGDERPGATGVSIFFPDSTLYDSSVGGGEVYELVADTFNSASRWNDYLSAHYYGTEMGEAPGAGQEISAPGASDIEISDIRLGADEINVADTTTLSAEVYGSNLGFIYTFTGYYNPEDDTILIADMDYIDAGASRQSGGINYPDWGDSDVVEIEYEWEPVLYGINDGNGVHFALLMPEDYGKDNEAATYKTKVMYHFATGGTRYAELFFKEGYLIKAVSYTGANGSGSPRAFKPRSGDSFTLLHDVILVHSDSDDPVEYTTEEGETIMIGDEELYIEEFTAPAGDYVIGLQATDLDENLYETYTIITVNE